MTSRATVVLAPVEAPRAAVEAAGPVILVVTFGGSVIGEVELSAGGLLSPAVQEEAIERSLGERIWRERLAADFTRAARGSFPGPSSARAPSVSVVVEDPWPALRASLEALDPQPLEVVSSVGEATGEVLAFLDGNLSLDPGWLQGLARRFEDQLVMSVNGYVGPSGRREIAPEKIDRFSFAQPRFGEGNVFVRREALADTGAGPGPELRRRLVAGGWRVAFEPAHVAWRTPPPGAPRIPKPPEAPFEAERLRPARVMRDESPPLSVAIASYNRRERLAQVLEALSAQTYPADRFEAVVVLDGSTDGSAERVRSLELPFAVNLVEQENRGLAATRNRGLREAAHPVVAFLDDDIVPEPQFVAEHATAHQESDQPVAALGVCPPANPGADLPSLAVRHFWEDYYRRRSEPDHIWNYTDFGDGNVSLPKSAVEAAGGWDESFARETVRRQDWELAVRLLKGGVRFVHRPLARGLHHFDHVDLATALRYRRIEGRADVLLGRRHPEVRGHLFMLLWLAPQPDGSMREYRFLADRRKAAEELVAAAGQAARLLERTPARKVAWKATVRLLGYSYLLGVREALPTDADLREFIAPVVSGEFLKHTSVELGATATLALPPAIGQLALDVRLSGAEIASVEAFLPETQWDWDVVTRRVVTEGLDLYRAAAAAPDPAPASTAGR